MNSAIRAPQASSSASRIALVVAGLAAAMLLRAAPASANVFGKDSRVKVTSAKYPYSTLGELDGVGCSATLVGRRLVLTAAHCIIDTSTHKLMTNLTTFSVGVVNGKARDSANMIKFWWGTTDPDNDRQHDWALILLDKPLGDKYGWMGVASEDDARKYKTVAVAGYSADRFEGNTATIDLHCHIREYDSDLWLHDGAVTRGSSGCPIFVNTKAGGRIVALNVGEFRDSGETSLFLNHYEKSHANIAVRNGEFLPTLNELITTYNQQDAEAAKVEAKLAKAEKAAAQKAKSQLAKSQLAKSQLAKSQLAKSQLAKSQLAKSQVAKLKPAKAKQASHQAAHRQSPDDEQT